VDDERFLNEQHPTFPSVTIKKAAEDKISLKKLII
jgi:hypothetical protein